MSGLDSEQLDELVQRIEDQLEEPWHKGIGRPKDLSLREAVVVACGYMRQNITHSCFALSWSRSVSVQVQVKVIPQVAASSPACRLDLAAAPRVRSNSLSQVIGTRRVATARTLSML